MRYKNSKVISLKYGNESISFEIGEDVHYDLIRPPSTSGIENQMQSNDFNRNDLLKEKFSGIKKPIEKIRIGICINDKTRPVPYQVLLPGILSYLISMGINKNQILFFIANGTHIPEEISTLDYLPEIIRTNYQIISHDCNDQANLLYLGKTKRGTPVSINKIFMECDIKISLGNIEPHHFAGYSGGVKSVAIGLAGKETILTNHKMLVLDESCACNYNTNPLRQDIEEIGQFSRVDFCLNTVKDVDKNIIAILWDTPTEVMRQAIKIVDRLFIQKVDKKYDLVIASAGGYPKDINLYQAQKAITNAAKITKDKGTVILVAECREGSGSKGYQDYMKKFSHPHQVITEYEQGYFEIGPHKALQFAFIQNRISVGLFSTLPDELTRSLLINPVQDINQFIQRQLTDNPNLGIAVMPDAVITIPKVEEK